LGKTASQQLPENYTMQPHTSDTFVKVIDINYNPSNEVLKRSSSLNGYSILVDKYVTNIKNGMSRDDAVVRAVRDCIAEGVLKDYLEANFMDVCKMLQKPYGVEELRQEIQIEFLVGAARKMFDKSYPIEEVCDILGISKGEVEFYHRDWLKNKSK